MNGLKHNKNIIYFSKRHLEYQISGKI